MTATLLQRRTACFAIFFCFGITMASWVTRTPDIRDQLGASTLEMGFILFGLSAGAMTGVLASSPLLLRIGARRMVTIGSSSAALGSAVVGAGAFASSGVVIAIGLALIGLGMGGAEVAINVEGAEVEAGLGRSTLPTMHGFYSLGTVAGAVVGIAATAAAFPVGIHLLVVAAIDAAVMLSVVRRIPVEVGLRSRGAAQATAAASAADTPAVPPRPLWRDPRLLLIGAVVLGLALAEGAAGDWLPLVMVDGHGFDPALGSAVFAVFAAAMATGRLLGGRLVDRIGPAASLCASALVSALGIGLVSLVDDQVVAAIGTVLWGLGAALGFPVAMSAAGQSGDRPQLRVAIAAQIAYVAFLVGPPVLGVLGQQVGLRTALLVVLGMVVIAAFGALGAPRRSTVPTAPPASSEVGA
jgi:fucose permease